MLAASSPKIIDDDDHRLPSPSTAKNHAGIINCFHDIELSKPTRSMSGCVFTGKATKPQAGWSWLLCLQHQHHARLRQKTVENLPKFTCSSRRVDRRRRTFQVKKSGVSRRLLHTERALCVALTWARGSCNTSARLAISSFSWGNETNTTSFPH